MRAPKHPATSRGRDKHVIAVLIEPDSIALEIVVLQHVFGPPIPSVAAITGEHESPYEVVLCGTQSDGVLRSGFNVGQLSSLETMLSADTVMIPGIEDPYARRSERLLDTVRQAHQAGARMVSFCGGAFILGYAGVLDSRRATTHWLLSHDFQAAFPRARLEAEHLFVDDGPVHTSGGFFAATDLSLHLLALDRGQAYANDAGRILVSAPHRLGGQSQFVKSSIRTDDQPTMGPLMAWIREHLDEPLTLARLARHQHISERTLARKFRQTTGMSVLDWITQERVNQAKVLLETTTHPVSEIAAMVGFGSPETLRRNFQQLVGTSAGRYRSAFQNPNLQTAS